MLKHVIYYPHMNLPKDAWFARVALYWDGIGTILPSAYDPATDPRYARRDALERHAFTRELIECGLVTPVHPEIALTGIPDFVSGFLKLLEDLTDRDHTELGRSSEAIHGDKLMTRLDLHADKLAPELVDVLRSRGLAKEGRTAPGWYYLERDTAALYMAYLALRLGEAAEVPMTPITDEDDSLRAFVAATTAKRPVRDLIHRKTRINKVLLGALLPGPVNARPLDIVKFKRKHHDELVSLRELIDDKVQLICAYRGDQFEHVVEEEAAKVREQAERLAAGMRDHGFKRIRWGFVSVVGATAGVAEVVAAPAPLAGIAALAAFSLALREVGRRRPLSDPLAYAVRSWREFDEPAVGRRKASVAAPT